MDQCTVEPSFFVVHDPHNHDDSAGPVGGSQELQLHGVVAGDGRKRTLAVGVPYGSTTSNSGYTGFLQWNRWMHISDSYDYDYDTIYYINIY